MRRPALALLLAASLAAPSAALAADPSPLGAWEITSVETGGNVLEVDGKLLVEIGSLTATVGCNTIGGEVTVDGDLVVLGALVTTEMACEGELAAAEAALLEVLGAGTLTYAPGVFVGDAGSISVVDVDGAPAPSAPADPGTPTDDPVVVLPPLEDPVPAFSIEQCIGILPVEELPPFIVDPAVEPPVVDDGSGSSGSGAGASEGSTGSGVTEPVVVDPMPVPAETSVPSKEDLLTLPPDEVVVLPVPGEEAPAPLVPPTEDECRELLARIRTMSTTGGDGLPVPVAADDAGAGMAYGEASVEEAGGEGLGGLVLLVALLAGAVVAGGGWLRLRRTA